LPLRLLGVLAQDSLRMMYKSKISPVFTFFLPFAFTILILQQVGIYGYGRNDNVSGANLHLSSAKALLKTIDTNFGTLVFCRRYLERLGVKNYLLGMRHLLDNGIVESYAPLADVKGSYTAQFEHTILIHSGGKEVISRGDDY